MVAGLIGRCLQGRAFRPLRMVNRIDGMKLVIYSLMAAAPALANVLLFLIFAVFLIFGILGLSLFLGKFHTCNDVEDPYIGGSDRTHCYGYNTDTSDFWTPKVRSHYPWLVGGDSCTLHSGMEQPDTWRFWSVQL